MSEFTCRLCGGRDARRIEASDAKSGGSLPIGFCTGCGLVQQWTLPSLESLRIYYAHTYRSDYKGVHTPKLKHVRRAGSAALSRLAFLRDAVPEEVRALAQRAPALTLLLRVGVDPLLLESLRRA